MKFSPQDAQLVDAKKRWSDLFDIQLTYDDAMRAAVEAMSDDQRRQLVSDAELFSATNCGWYEYAAMHVAAAETARALRLAASAEPVETP